MENSMGCFVGAGSDSLIKARENNKRLQSFPFAPLAHCNGERQVLCFDYIIRSSGIICLYTCRLLYAKRWFDWIIPFLQHGCQVAVLQFGASHITSIRFSRGHLRDLTRQFKELRQNQSTYVWYVFWSVEIRTGTIDLSAYTSKTCLNAICVQLLRRWPAWVA